MTDKYVTVVGEVEHPVTGACAGRDASGRGGFAGGRIHDRGACLYARRSDDGKFWDGERDSD